MFHCKRFQPCLDLVRWIASTPSRCSRQSILGYHAGSGHNDFSRFLAGDLQCIGVNALPRSRIPIRVAGNGVVLAVVVSVNLREAGLTAAPKARTGSPKAYARRIGVGRAGINAAMGKRTVRLTSADTLQPEFFAVFWSPVRFIA